ncbi:hypothetical protein J41TS12_10930 [Paenibacillus antibioticophila]|uniref:Uncharacterized protein n=1 Tax=Paenibacillus antibioticophila TaxID=1274374 RepID=A0A919XT66_9BACL|nr:hypothetical protein [Paenibacillus antibioticophila]GIO36232.1 hypothetical protein J41TS12_10930 [Paenibacillus antibioticophila]
MGQDHAKFTAEIAKGINIKESNVELKLLIPLKAAQDYLIFLSSNQGEKVNVFLGDPQGSFDFGDDEEDAMYQKFTGRYETTDSSGVVTKVEKPDGQEDDENQQTLFGQELEGDPAANEPEGDAPEGDGDSDPDQAGSGLDEEVPDWMKGIDDRGEMEFADDGSSQDPTTPEDELTDFEREIMGDSAGDQQDDAAEISKEQLEQYILQNRPAFPDMEFNFPELLEKRYQGTTWLTLSKELGVSSGQLSTKFKKYKEEVEKLMKGNGVA